MMLGLPVPADRTPRFFWKGAKPQLTDDVLQGPFIAIAPWSTAKTFDLYQPSGNKNWPLENWSSVIDWGRRKGFRIVQLRGSQEEPLLEGVDLDFCGRPLREAFACIERASMLVSVDTMAHHAAAAFGVPSVVLWGRSKSCHFGYEKPHIINIQGDCPGMLVPAREGVGDPGCGEGMTQERPCINGDQWAMDQQICPIPGHPCMAAITVKQVLDAMDRLALEFSLPKSVSVAA